MKRVWFVVAFLLWCSSAAAQSLTLSPAVVPLGGKPGQSTHRHLTLFNGTGHRLAFQLRAQDVVVRDGARVFVEAGEVAASIAATAVFSRRIVELDPGEERTVDVTLTLPRNVGHRAVVILFQGTTLIGGKTTVSIGSLFTFDITGRVSLAPGQLEVIAATASRNAMFRLPVVNDGSEPAIVRAAAAIVGPTGALVGKLALDTRRLLPGEQMVLGAEYPGELRSGAYRVITTIESAKHAWTRTAQLVVP